MSNFQLHLLGSIQLLDADGAEPYLRSDKVRALLAYLVLEAAGHPIRRQHLAQLLWPDYLGTSARKNLRQSLFNLRKAFAPLELIQADRHTVTFDADHPDFWCDVLALEPSSAAESGPLLQGLVLDDCPRFMAWVAERRSQIDVFDQEKSQQMESQSPEADSLPPAAQELPAHNLPRTTTPFFGRRELIEETQRYLCNSNYPLVTLVGLGGVGKTRMAIAAAQQVVANFKDGVWFVPLAGVSAERRETRAETKEAMATAIATAIASAMRLPLRGDSISEQLLQQLNGRELLLVLDNFEHLVASSDFVRHLVERLRGLHVLVTSRQRLGYQMEQIVQVKGLPVPPQNVSLQNVSLRNEEAERDDDGVTRTEIHQYPSVQLFAERANRTLSGFTLTAQNATYVVAICRAVEGLPLGIELAAALLNQQPLEQIAEALPHELDLLATDLRDVDVRHQSLRAVFEHSTNLLPDEVAQTLARCSVFRGGFTQEAAQEVAEMTPAKLSALLGQSLIRRTENGRYDLHELVRQFAAEKLADQADREEVLHRHSHHYLNHIGAHLREFEHGLASSTFDATVADLDNIRHAWQHALSQQPPALSHKAIQSLITLMERQGLLKEGLHRMSQALGAFEADTTASSGQRDDFLSRIHLGRARFLLRLGRHGEGEQTAALSYRLAQRGEMAAMSLWVQARCAQIQGRAEEAEQILSQALIFCQSDDLLFYRAIVLNSLSMTARLLGNSAAAISYGTEAMEASQQADNLFGLGTSQWMLAESYSDRGDYWRARELASASDGLMRPLGENLQWSFAALALARADAHLGRYSEAVRLGKKVLELARELEATEIHALALGVLAHATFGLSESDPAQYSALDKYNAIEALGAEANHIRTRRGALIGLAKVDVYRAHALAARGHSSLAQELYNSVVAMASQTDDRERAQISEGSLDARTGLAQVAQETGAPQRAMQCVEETLSILSELPELLDGHSAVLDLPFIYFTCYRVLHANDDPRAAQILDKTVRLLQTQAQQIPDPAARRHFLEGISLHRAICHAHKGIEEHA